MPRVSDRPRSAGGRRVAHFSSRHGGGRVSSAAARIEQVLPHGRQDLHGRGERRGTTFSRFDRQAVERAQDLQRGVGPGFTVVRVVIDAVSAPFYSLDNLLSGRPLQSAKNLATS